VTSAPTEPRFNPGDHLRVHRRGNYDHHGIYVSEARVIQFGRGIFDKPRTTVEAVSLEDFEDGAHAELIKHGVEQRWFSWLPWPRVWLPPADRPDRIIRRAEWLCEHHPAGRYHLIGWNCEHAANFCVNEYTESLQVRRLFFVNAWTGAPFAWYVSCRAGQGRPMSPRVVLARVAYSVLVIGLYNAGIRRFWQDIGREWQAYDRTQPAA
jgi:Lecithin retinol acyltransferase